MAELPLILSHQHLAKVYLLLLLTGTISGTPSATATLQVYTITANNVTNSDSATLSITVNPAAITFSLDVDGNQTLNATNDGLIIFKYLLNSNANNLHTDHC